MQLTYTGDPGRYYPTLAIAPEPGQSYDLPADPGDGRWTPSATAKTTKTTPAAAPADPAPPESKEG